jgi:hypothetical protein
MNLDRPVYSHQRLDVYRVALEFARESSKLRVSPALLADQFTRSSNSRQSLAVGLSIERRISTRYVRQADRREIRRPWGLRSSECGRWFEAP